eukprot:10790648-Lingulodinium_polyedra.AAC.1
MGRVAGAPAELLLGERPRGHYVRRGRSLTTPAAPGRVVVLLVLASALPRLPCCRQLACPAPQRRWPTG